MIKCNLLLYTVTKTNKYTDVYENINVIITPTCFGHSCGHPQGGELRKINTLRCYKFVVVTSLDKQSRKAENGG
jgi:hypothetical protein